MFFPDDPTAVAGQYIDGVPGGAHGTSIRADHMNAITNEIANSVQGAGVALVKAQNDQLLKAITELGIVAATQVAFRNVKEVDAGFGKRIYAMCEGSSTGVSTLIAVGETTLIRRSYDGGDTWTAETAGTPPFTGDFRCCVDCDGVIVAAGQTGEIQTRSSGGTWSASPSAGSGYTGTFMAAAYAPATTPLVCLFGTGGEIQTAAAPGGPYTRRKTGGGNFVAACAGASWVLGVDADGKVWRADPLVPGTWTQVLDSPLAPATLNQMQWYDGTDHTRICYKTEGTTFYLSDDLGLTWTTYTDTSGTEILSIYPAPNKTWLGLGGSTLYVHAFDLRRGPWVPAVDLMSVTNTEAEWTPFVYLTTGWEYPNRLLTQPGYRGEDLATWASLFAPG